MIQITNLVSDFFENSDEEIVIYGAGNAGYWIGHYMNICEIPFSFYLDKGADSMCTPLLGHPVFLPEKLSEYKGRTIRIVVSSIEYKSILYDFLCLAQKYSINALCLVPEFVTFVTKENLYNINKLLAYFRRKLFVRRTPSIISYECSAGQIYEMMGLFMQSPTINTTFDYEDYLKLCLDPRKYLNADVVDMHFERFMKLHYKAFEYEIVPKGRLLDINVWFPHDNEPEKCSEKWKLLRKNIDWDNMVYLMVSREKTIPVPVLEKFSKLEQPHLTVFEESKELYIPDGYSDYIYSAINLFDLKDNAIENHFDLLGWMNKVCKEI